MVKTMAALKRKTFVLCRYCHNALHAGRPTRRRMIQEESLQG